MTTTSPKQTYNYIGCDYYGTHADHLVPAMGLGVTANSYNEEYLHGNQVIIIAREGDRLFGFLALATGETVGDAGQYWPKYHRPESITSVILPITRIHEVPAEIAGRMGQRGVASANREAVATYLLVEDNRRTARS
jgi:hypothetical protein